MLVCHCFSVNDRRIRAAIAEGARDEIDVASACGAGRDCGGCLPAVQRLLDECLRCSRVGDLSVDVAAPMAVG